ncbi:MAG TPA: CotH kinase family protein [Humisphaera sp.]
MSTEPLSRRSVLALAASASLAALLPRGGAAFGQAAATRPAAGGKKYEDRKAFFAAGKVPALSIELTKEAYQSLRGEPRKYVKCQIREDEKALYTDVAVHLKGAAGSTRGVDDKPGMTFNTDKYTEGQSFHGLDKWHLNNSVQDPGYLSELFCGELYRAAGVPASMCTHASVVINGRKVGFYLLKEGYDKGFLKAHFGTTNGNFYDGGFLKDLDQPLELNHAGKDTPKDQAELKSLVEACREGDANRRFERMDRRLDTEKFVTYLALQMYTTDWDGYPRNRNNYRVFYNGDTKKITFIPSGMDQMFNDPGMTMFPDVGALVSRAFMDTPEGKKRYVARVRQLLQDVLVTDKWVNRLTELQERILPAMKAVDEGAARDFPNQVKRLKDAVKTRNKVIGEQLAKLKA